MHRRSFIAGAGIAAAASAFPKPAIAQGVTELKLVMSWPKGFPGLGTAAARFAERFETATEGRYRIKIFGAGELVHPLKCLDALQEGAADLYHSADYYYQGKLTGLSFFTTVPFGLTANEQDAWLQFGGGQALWDEASAQFGVKPFPCGNTGSQMGGWFKKEMRTLDDFKGLRMRIPGFGGDVLAALGGAPSTIAGSEILTALQSGAIDATEWVGPYNDLAFGLYKVVKHYHYPGFHEPGPTLSLGIRLPLYEKMSKNDQAILAACALAENNICLAEFNANNARALETLITKHGVLLHEFPDEIFKAAATAARDILAKAGQADPLTAKIYASYSAFAKSVREWSRISDKSYLQKRALDAL